MQEKTSGILKKPPNVASDPVKSQKWDELTAGRRFTESDIPTLSILCQWHKLAQQAMDELDNFGGNTAYTNDMGDIKSFPQIDTLKKCSNEIRQLNKQLGITDTHEEEQVEQTQSAEILTIIQGNRKNRSARAKAGNRAS